MNFRFTGQPFVDAGIAGMCAAADVASLSELDTEAVGRAVQRLLRIMTSPSAFKERLQGKKKSVFATSEMSVIFPNGPHANPSGKPSEKADRYARKVRTKWEAVLGESASDLEACFVDGGVGQFRVGNDEFPLVDSKGKRNFHPGHQEGHCVSAATALALEFFPLSVLRTGTDEGLFWFIHTADEEIAIACAQRTIRRIESLIAQNAGLGFFGDWRVAARTPAAAFVALIRDIMTSGNLLAQTRISSSPLPITAYVFSNDNRSASISGQDLPHELFRYFNALHSSDRGVDRFQREVLENEQTCWRVATKMLAREPIVRICCIRASKDQPPRLRGGWEAHSLYATEVLGMSGDFVRAIEQVSERIFEHEDMKKAVLALRGDEPPVQILLSLVRRGMMTDEEYQLLVPPTDRSAPFAARDYLLACIYERTHAEALQRPFLRWPGVLQPRQGEKHPLLEIVERAGEKILSADRGKRAANDLARVQRPTELRGVFLNFVRRGLVTWPEFVYLFPPEPGSYLPAYSARDYLLAYLYSHLRDLQDMEAVQELESEGEEA